MGKITEINSHDHKPEHNHKHEHEHSHNHSHAAHHCGGAIHSNASVGKMGIVFFITLVILAVEITGGIISNSLALLSDAGHVFTDLAAIGLSTITVMPNHFQHFCSWPRSFRCPVPPACGFPL